MLNFYFLTLSLLLPLVSCFTSLSTTNYNAALNDLTSLLTKNPSIHPTALRLAFHDCVGGCNGCINLNSADNAGLQNVINSFESLYRQKYRSILSRADFWALGGIASVSLGIQLSNNGCTSGSSSSCFTPNHSIVFKWGRIDCSTSPYTSDLPSFPTPNLSGAEVNSYFASQFPGMTETDVTALLGAHTLGGASERNSGYRGRWKNGASTTFNNGYYKLIVDSTINYANVNVANTSCSCSRWQWNGSRSGNPVSFMLNTDLSLYKNLNLNSEGKATCNFKTTCPLASTTSSSLVTKYATTPSDFVKDFSVAYTKMTSNGYSSLNSLT